MPGKESASDYDRWHFLSSACYREDLICVCDLHVVEIDVIGSAVSGEIKLEGIGQLRSIAGEEGCMRDVHGRGNAIHRQRIMDNRGTRCVINSDDVVPRIGRETLQNDACAFPMLRCEVENPPSVAVIVSLPGKVVRIPIGILLALEFDGLRRAHIL